MLEWEVDDSLDFDFAVQYLKKDALGNILQSADLTLPADPPLANAARLFLGGMGGGNGSFDAVIETLKGVGRVRVLSQPSIMVTCKPGPDPSVPTDPVPFVADPNAQPVMDSKLTNGSRVPYAMSQFAGPGVAEITQYRNTGVTMEISVPCVKNNLIFMDMRATVSDVAKFINVGSDVTCQNASVPIINSRSIQNRLLVPDRTIFIAGLMKTTHQVERRSGIPWLSEIPGLRWLLSSLKKQNVTNELVFLVKPEIVTPYRVIGAEQYQEGYGR